MSGLELPEPDIPWYIPKAIAEGRQPFGGLRPERPSKEIAEKALDTYQRAFDNAIALVAEARLLKRNGHHARAFALACTALEEIGKSQYAADVYTGFIPPDGFEQNIRDHKLKTGYAARGVQSGEFVEPFLRDKDTPKKLLERRNDALYASSTNRLNNDTFESDAGTMIDYCKTWIEQIRSQEQIAERIGTKAFLR